jgi:hypothetical protein
MKFLLVQALGQTILQWLRVNRSLYLLNVNVAVGQECKAVVTKARLFGYKRKKLELSHAKKLTVQTVFPIEWITIICLNQPICSSNRLFFKDVTFICVVAWANSVVESRALLMQWSFVGIFVSGTGRATRRQRERTVEASRNVQFDSRPSDKHRFARLSV